MLSIRAFLRPMRSAMNPNRTPPMPEASSMKVFGKPVKDLLVTPRSDITRTAMLLYSITSKPSSPQPIAAASRVRFWPEVISDARNVVTVAMRGDSISLGQSSSLDKGDLGFLGFVIYEF